MPLSYSITKQLSRFILETSSQLHVLPVTKLMTDFLWHCRRVCRWPLAFNPYLTDLVHFTHQLWQKLYSNHHMLGGPTLQNINKCRHLTNPFTIHFKSFFNSKQKSDIRIIKFLNLIDWVFLGQPYPIVSENVYILV